MFQPPIYTISQADLIFIVLLEDAIIHTDEHPFCSDPECGCHEDSTLTHEYINKPLDNGLLTNSEAMRLFWGKQIVSAQDAAITDEEIAEVMNEPSPLEEDYYRSFFDGLDPDDLEDHPF